MAKVYMLLSGDDNHADVHDELHASMVANDLPYHMFLNGDRLEGGPVYSAGVHLSDAMLTTMKNSGIVSFGSHSYNHTSLAPEADPLVWKAQIDDNEALLAPWWAGKHKTFAPPSGSITQEQIQYLVDSGYKLNRCLETMSTSLHDFGTGEFLGATGLPHDPMRMLAMGDLNNGGQFSDVTDLDPILDLYEQTGGIVNLYFHKFVTTPGSNIQEYAISKIAAFVNTLATRVTGGTLEIITFDSLATRLYGPAAGGGGPITRRRRR